MCILRRHGVIFEPFLLIQVGDGNQLQNDEFYNLDHAERLSFHRDMTCFVFRGTTEAKIGETSRVTIHMKKAVIDCSGV